MKTKVLQDYKGIREGGPCLIIGNGPSLKGVPIEFVRGIPCFACNFFPMYAPQIEPDYLVIIDKTTMTREKLWGWIYPSTLVLCFARWAGNIPKRDNIVWWANRDDLVRGFTTNSKWGQYFPTSAHAAVWIADYMGFDEFFLIGMDGTSQQRELAGVDDEGKSTVPHFYDEHPGKASKLWDIAWGNMAHFVGKKGKTITNLSIETAITQIPRRDYRDFYEPNIGCWVWPGDHKRAGRIAISASTLLYESVAPAPPYIARALDGVGHMAISGNPADRIKIEKVSYTPKPEDLELLQEHLRGKRT